MAKVKVTPFKHDREFMQLHNSIFDVVMPSLQPNAWKVYCFLIRKTHGFGKSSDAVSLRQISEGCGMGSLNTVRGALDTLTQNKLIIAKVATSKWHSTRYRINHEVVLEWDDSVSETDTGEKTSVSKIDTARVSEIDTATVSEIDTSKDLKIKRQVHAAPKTQPPPTAGAIAPCVPTEHNAMDNNHEKFCLPDEAKRNRRIIETITRDATETSMILSFLGFLPLQLTKASAKTQIAAARDIIGGGGTEADLRRAWLDSRGQNGQRPFTVNDLHSLKGRTLAIAAERRSKPAPTTPAVTEADFIYN